MSNAKKIREPKHLIKKICNRGRQEVLIELKKACGYLAKHGKLALIKAADIDSNSSWGCSVKRVRVDLPVDRPSFINPAVSSHSLIEVMNQCATLDRLIDAMEWSVVHLPKFDRVLVCHPTTSSSKKALGGDNDLILARADDQRCRFEVSDVASAKDGNGKEEKDLISLGALRTGKKLEKLKVVWPMDRLFLVVSSEFAEGISTRSRVWNKEKHLEYKPAIHSGTTVLFEVLKAAVAMG